MASCVRNIRTKNYLNLVICFELTVTNVRNVFMRHSVHCITEMSHFVIVHIVAKY